MTTRNHHTQCSLYMPSTPLNVLVSCAYALQRQKEAEIFSPPYLEQAELWLIDQKNVATNPYLFALLAWESSPFQSIKIFSGVCSGKKKLAERRQNFAQIKKGLTRFTPQQVMVGSDRRVEFQFTLAHLKSLGTPAKGVYLDDGLYSYMGRKSSCLSDGVNAILKKMTYGFWWQEPRVVGASNWIQEAWLFAPEQAVPQLQQKKCDTLEPQWFRTPEILALSQRVAHELAFDATVLEALDVMLLIPHPANVQKMVGYQARLQAVIRQLCHQGKRVGVKYHPRAPSEDYLLLASQGAVDIIPAALAFEFCLPSLASECKVIGDVGTALLTTKWLRPDLSVYAVLDESDAFQKPFVSLNKRLDISVIQQIEDIVE
ncbi:MAG: alpha-2,8-polysialyltransferase family protein [Thiomicrorhabdus sp.]|nr:alpha-2,8-polysialyltransferase family protein [Thiomicrorhabdus sp.]